MTFFDNYTYKQKNYALLVIGVLLVAVSYKRAFSVTAEKRAYISEMESQIERAKQAGSEIRMKQNSIQRLNEYLGKENSTVEEVQQGFLNFFARKAINLQVYKIDEVLKFQHPDFTINTHQITIKGNYVNALQFLYALERNFKLGRLINVSFAYKKMSSEEPEALYTTLLIQNYLR